MGNPRGVVQAVCEYGVMSLPLLARWDSRWRRQFLLEEIGEQDNVVAFRTVAAQAYRASKQVTFGTAPLTERTPATAWTLVHRVGDEQPLALELLADDHRVDGGQALVAQPIGELFTSRVAINRTTAR